MAGFTYAAAQAPRQSPAWRRSVARSIISGGTADGCTGNTSQNVRHLRRPLDAADAQEKPLNRPNLAYTPSGDKSVKSAARSAVLNVVIRGPHTSLGAAPHQMIRLLGPEYPRSPRTTGLD